LLKLDLSRTVRRRSVCKTPTRELNHPFAIFHIVFFLVLACVFDSQARIRRGQSSSAQLITRGEVVLRLRGSSLIDWKPDRLYDISTKSIVTSPDRRSGTPVPITPPTRKTKIPKELSHSGMEIKVWSKDLVKLLYHLTILFPMFFL
jgi:hypothetical protein